MIQLWYAASSVQLIEDMAGNQSAGGTSISKGIDFPLTEACTMMNFIAASSVSGSWGFIMNSEAGLGTHPCHCALGDVECIECLRRDNA